MKKFLLASLLIIVSIAINAQNVETYSYEESSTRIAEPTPASFVLTPLSADIQVIGDKISYTETFTDYIVDRHVKKLLPELKVLTLIHAAKNMMQML